jgi:hypothetical protein
VNESERKSRWYARAFIILFLVYCAQLACTFGVVFGVVSYAKDSARLTTEDPVRPQALGAQPPVPRPPSVPRASTPPAPSAPSCRVRQRDCNRNTGQSAPAWSRAAASSCGQR